MNRKVLLASLFLATTVPTVAYAQEDANLLSTRKNLLSRAYLRPSISEIYITDGSHFAKEIAAAMKQQTNEQFDVNVIPTNTFSHTPKEGEDIKGTISTFLNQAKVGNQIMKSWFPEFVNAQEGYTFRVLEERGKYAATDNDVLKNNASARKTTLNELGEQLIDRSYVKVYNIYTNDKNKVKVDTYLYKLDFNDEVRTSFYENYFTKPNGIEQANFPLVYVAETSSDATPEKSEKTGEYNYLATAENAYKWINTSLAKKVADFKVQTAVFATSPIRAKIGKKENVKIDDRYDVVELVQDSEGNEVSRRKAVVRVGSYIADNRTEATGSTEDFTRFYKFVGGSVQEGMTLVHHPEVGLSISPYAQTNGFGAILEYRTKLYPGLSGYIKFDLPYGKKIVNGELKSGLTSIEVGKESVAFYNLGLGAIKEFNFARNLSWSVGIGGGYFGHTGDDEALGKDDKLKTYYGEALGRFGIMFSPNFQLFAQASYTYHLSVGDRNFAKIFRELDMIRPFGLGIGAKISF